MFTLPNGLTVILHEDHSVPLVSVNVWYHVGSANEKPGRTGFAHLFEHLMFEGSGTSRKACSTRFSRPRAASNIASTSNDKTNYFIDSLERAGSRAVSRVRSHGLPPRHRLGALVNGQRDVVKNERRQSYENEPYGMAEVRIPELMYPKNTRTTGQ